MLAKIEIKCPDNCGETFLYDKLSQHRNECKVETVSCPCCKSEVKKGLANVKLYYTSLSKQKELEETVISLEKQLEEVKKGLGSKKEIEKKVDLEEVSNIPSVFESRIGGNSRYIDNYEKPGKRERFGKRIKGFMSRLFTGGVNEEQEQSIGNNYEYQDSRLRNNINYNKHEHIDTDYRREYRRREAEERGFRHHKDFKYSQREGEFIGSYQDRAPKEELNARDQINIEEFNDWSVFDKNKVSNVNPKNDRLGESNYSSIQDELSYKN
eukprot:CAMPEP_0170523836 /NCGR_PEP_ID=MMETSP0209-20121228/9271_1 /TAXON_ID=665100 ORGANISM="Litonotus pictus, Strain P1" /NCGR_SAMPLE_ID=MMETSP0209 /ASSEMBLY_ACC=CAM_ASM_000301 /LENGTH=267 /DNA_ID=CAMNT_0010812163 /DNA_START=197 /DNA_END=997 /DNA_ORIENTATION=-